MANALLILQESRKAEKTELDALVTQAEAAETAEATMAALEASKARRAELVASITAKDEQIALETQRRAQAGSEPAIADPLVSGSPASPATPSGRPFSADDVRRMHPAEYEKNRAAIWAQAHPAAR